MTISKHKGAKIELKVRLVFLGFFSFEKTINLKVLDACLEKITEEVF